MSENAKPVYRLRYGNVAAAVWARNSSAGYLFDTTFKRVFKDGEPGDLEPRLAELEEVEQVPAAALLVKLYRVQTRSQEAGMSLLLETHILPAVLKRFDYEHGGRDRLESFCTDSKTTSIDVPLTPICARPVEIGSWTQCCRHCHW